MNPVTVAIPTHNRAASLRDTLGSVGALRAPEGVSLQCLVVDNCSSDDTAAVVASFASTAPIPVRCVREERLGSSFARNRAVDESGTELIFFIDDDALADPSWAAALFAEMKSRGLDAACGPVLPRWSAPRPAWLGPSLLVKLAVHDERTIAQAPDTKLESMENYFSANVGFRRDTFARFGKFREDLGVVGGNPMSGEDTELFQRIVAAGGRMGFVRGAIVHHVIPPSRMTRNYLLRKSFAFGVGSACAGGRSHNQVDKLFRNVIRMTTSAARGDAEHTLYHQLEVANFLGYWRGRLLSRK